MRHATSLLMVLVFAASLATAQTHGVAPSVTSFGFGGSQNPAPGVPASITSLGPQGFTCCANLRMSAHPNFVGGPRNFRRHEHALGGFVPFYAPTYTPSYIAVEPDTSDDEEDGGGPTIFDRRGPRRQAPQRAYDRGYDEGRADEQDRQDRENVRIARAARLREELATDPRGDTTKAATPSASSVSAPAVEPRTALVFRDGHNEEVTNYAIIGDQLYDFTSGKRRIAIADLDLAATTKANDARGMDFRLPEARPGN